jgi:hypothetical protein
VALAAGCIIGLGFLAKQTAVVGLGAVALCLLVAVVDRRLAPPRAAWYGAALGLGAAVPVALAVAAFARAGAAWPFLHQIGWYNARYVREAALPPMDHEIPVLVLMLGLPLCALLLALGTRTPRGRAIFVPLLALSSLVTLVPRFGEYHYQQALPFTALSAGFLCATALRWPFGRVMAPLGQGLAIAMAGLLALAVGMAGAPAVARALQGPSGPKVLEEPLEPAVIAWLQEQVAPNEPILVVGDTRLHMATGTVPASRLLYVFPWTYDREMLLEDLARARPRIAVVFDGALEDPLTLEYLSRHYQPVFHATDATILWRQTS